MSLAQIPILNPAFDPIPGSRNAVPFRPIILLPIYNHATTVAAVLGDIRRTLPDLPILAINDGSTDDTGSILAAAGVEVLTQPVNLGKGAALTRAFLHAQGLGFTHALTIDADGQHPLADASVLIAAARQNPDDLIIGNRDFASAANVPAASLKGANFSRFWLHVQTGQDIPDSQCGMRIYPLAHTAAIRTWFKRFDYETEILARLAWAGLTIRSIPIRCIYFPPEQRISHYRPLRDTVRGVRVNVLLVIRRLLPLPFHRQIPRSTVFVHRFGPWHKASSWARAIRRMSSTGSTNSQLSAAIAVGVFIGLTPTFPLQTLITLYLAARLHLNPLAALLGSHISIPPLMPFWVILWIQTGSLLLNGHLMSAVPIHDLSWSILGQWLWIILCGSLVVASVVSVLSLFLSRVLLDLLRKRGKASA